MASIDILFPFILSWEGGYSNDPNDLGGPTNKGVTIADYREYRKQCGLPEPSIEDLKRITDAEVMDLLKRRYWDQWKADQIVSQGVANALVDYALIDQRSLFRRHLLKDSALMSLWD